MLSKQTRNILCDVKPSKLRNEFVHAQRLVLSFCCAVVYVFHVGASPSVSTTTLTRSPDR